MKTLNVEQRLGLATQGVTVLRQLVASNGTMQYDDFAQQLGLKSKTDTFTAQHRDQVTAILSVMAAVERQGLGGRDRIVAPLDFDRIVNKHGKPGVGIAKQSRIERKK